VVNLKATSNFSEAIKKPKTCLKVQNLQETYRRKTGLNKLRIVYQTGGKGLFVEIPQDGRDKLCGINMNIKLYNL